MTKPETANRITVNIIRDVKPVICIGIDPGVNFGVAVWSAAAKQFSKIETYDFFEGLTFVINYASRYSGTAVLIRFEDARLRKWFSDGKGGSEAKGKAMGAGAVKVLCSIIETELKKAGIEYEAVAPKNNRTKLSAEQFKKITGWQGRTNEHSRDAAMLVFGL